MKLIIWKQNEERQQHRDLQDLDLDLDQHLGQHLDQDQVDQEQLHQEEKGDKSLLVPIQLGTYFLKSISKKFNLF